MNLKTVWEGDPDNIPDGYCTVDEKGIITDPECIKFTTPDLTTIVQKIVGKTGWKRNNSVGFLFETNTTRDTDEELLDSVGFRRIVASTDPNEGGSIAPYINDDTNNTTRPKLEVKYKIAFDDAVAEKQMVGLRFEAIDIPRGAKVADAYITFTSAEDISTSANLSIKAEAASAAMFNESPRNISDRTLTNASVSWSPDSWSKGLSYESPNLKSIVQEVVNNSDWCSGDLAFILSSDDLTSIRKASSFDYSSGLAPELRVRFDTEDIQPGGGCVNKTFYSNISERTDDGEEKTSGTENGNIFLLSDKLETGIYGGEERLVAFRFRAVPIGNGAQVVGAHVMVNSKVANTNNDNATFRVYGELSTNPEEFSNENFSFSKRKATATVEWKPGVWERGRVYRTSDLASIIQEIVNQPEWMAYSDIVILIKGSGLRFIVPFDDNQSLAASLRIQIKGNLGDDGQGEIMTVRRRLRNLVRRMQIPKSSTPIVGALFESAQYYLGGNVVNGKSRSNNSLYLVSHPATHNSENAIPDGCNINLNPYAPECAGEEIVSSAARYEPPPLSTSSCQSSHIVLLTDGRANVSLKQAAQQKSDIEGLIPSSCVDTFTLGGKTIQISNNEKCGIDLSDYLSEEKNIIVHTIGFQLGTAWLGRYLVDGEYYAGPKMSGPKMGKYFKTTETSTSISTEDMGDGVRFTQAKLGSVLPPYIKDIDDTEENLKAVDYLCRLASPGGGNDEKCSGRNFYLAKTVEELAAAFSNISAQATSTNSSFAAPSISVNNLNKLRHKDDIYYSVFRPKPEPRWHGNIKRYKFIDGSLKDVNNKEATNENGHIADGTTSFWSDPGDGGNVTAGGLGGELTSSNRKIYTYFGNLQPGINHRANLANSQIKPFESATATTGFEKSLVTELLVAEELGEGADLSEEETAARDEEANNLIEWIIGNNTTEGEGSSTTQPTEPTEPDADNPEEESGDYIRIGEGDRWAFSDPLHSTPRVILYIGAEKDSEEQSEGNEESRLFVGTNDGLVRMADVANGKEKWAFMPKELLSKQSNLKDQIPEDSSGGDSSHTYGVDATPTFFINTSDGQIIPSKGNFATMYVGMRRGGRNVYAFDVTDKDGIPKPMWTIKGGEGEGTENNFIKLGQTWSAPIITEVSSDYCPYPWCRVVMFAGGYDPVVERDGKFNPAKQPITMGNAIYMVDPESGKLLWWASSDPDADLVLPKMTYAIPSDLSLQDIDGDGIIDRIYVGDIGGQLWRIDLDKADDDPHKGGIIAEFAGGSNPNMRSFFYPPALARIEGKNILTAVTGARPNPLA
ncbi:MAG: hypothetical protein KAG43_10360, partial [Candidatus Marithrix sp.]|nr:hypothetical protein [Candidatus Marithrix sp.]